MPQPAAVLFDRGRLRPIPLAHLPAIPRMDGRLTQVVIVAEHAQRGRRKHQATSLHRSKPDPTDSENPQAVAVTKEEHIAAVCTNSADDAVRTLAHGLE